MARIRTIKPEFPQSESIGRLTRDGRLCFILLWTLADDSGRLRGNSRMLASLLYPYDDDAKQHMDGWIAELERQECVVRYQVDGETFIEICNWLKHQKIDKPSPSKIPSIPGGFARIREDSKKNAADQGSRTKDQGRDQGERATPAARASRLTQESLPPDWKAFCQTDRPDLDPERVFAKFSDYWKAKPGKAGQKLNWLATWRNWVREERAENGNGAKGKFNVHAYTRGQLAETLASEGVDSGSS